VTTALGSTTPSGRKTPWRVSQCLVTDGPADWHSVCKVRGADATFESETDEEGDHRNGNS
jgi:hypothetical protein